MKPQATDREIHEYVRDRIRQALGGRSWAWLAQASGVPASTLSNQVNRPKFSLGVLVRIARALDHDPAYFLPVSGNDDTPASEEVGELVVQVERLLEQIRRRTGGPWKDDAVSEIRDLGS